MTELWLHIVCKIDIKICKDHIIVIILKLHLIRATHM